MTGSETNNEKIPASEQVHPLVLKTFAQVIKAHQMMVDLILQAVGEKKPIPYLGKGVQLYESNEGKAHIFKLVIFKGVIPPLATIDILEVDEGDILKAKKAIDLYYDYGSYQQGVRSIGAFEEKQGIWYGLVPGATSLGIQLSYSGNTFTDPEAYKKAIGDHEKSMHEESFNRRFRDEAWGR